MSRRHLLLSSTALLIGVTCALRTYADKPIETGEPETVHHRLNPHYEFAATEGSTAKTTPITHHGGPVMGGQVNAYVIWYGNWNRFNGTDTPQGQALVRAFLAGIGGSPYMEINKSYSIVNGTAITGGVTFGGETSISAKGPQANKLGDRDIGSIVQTAIQNGALPKDVNGVYFVLTSSDVSESSGFCTRYCGWHTRGGILGSDIKYSFVGNAARCLNACSEQLNSPNGNAGVDAMISVIAHELEEAISDPDLNAWYDASGAENADKCAWTFGKTATTPGGASYNVVVGGLPFLIQRNLFHAGAGDYCGLSVGGPTGALQTYPGVTAP
jgi:hypothetical protein